MANPNNETRPTRPVLVWIISGLIIVFVVGLNLYLLLHVIGLGANTEYASRVATITTVDYVRRVVALILSLAAAISLFFLRKWAVWLFFVCLLSSVAFIAYSYAIGMMAPNSLLSSMAAAVASLGLPLWYAFSLSRKGVLR